MLNLNSLEKFNMLLTILLTNIQLIFCAHVCCYGPYAGILGPHWTTPDLFCPWGSQSACNSNAACNIAPSVGPTICSPSNVCVYTAGMQCSSCYPSSPVCSSPSQCAGACTMFMTVTYVVI